MPTKADWTFINTFAGWLSAVGTLLAVVVSLYFSQRDSRIRLRVNAGIRKLLIGAKVHVVKDAPDFLVIAVTNVGRRTASVTGLCWKNLLIPRSYVYQNPGEAPLSAQIPAKLGDGDEADFTVRIETFEHMNDPTEFGRYCLPRPRILTARFLRMQVRTSTGKTFSVLVEKELRRWLVQWVEGKRPSSPAEL
jgi:hypothetical protein